MSLMQPTGVSRPGFQPGSKLLRTYVGLVPLEAARYFLLDIPLQSLNITGLGEMSTSRPV